MEKGGYQIIDLKDNNITTTPLRIKGVYRAVNGSYRKVLLLSGLKINGVEMSDEFVKAVKIVNDYILHAYSVVADNALTNYDIYIEDDDNVTLQIKTVSGSETPVTGQTFFTVKESE